MQSRLSALVKKHKIIVLTAIVVFAPILLWMGVDRMQKNTQERQLNRDFAMALVKSLWELNQNGNVENENLYMTAYSMKQHVENAGQLMEKWKHDNDPLRGGVAREMLEGIEDLAVAAKVFLDAIIENDSGKGRLAQFQVSLDAGREKVGMASIGIIFWEEGPINLSRAQETEVIEFINTLFEKEIAAIEEQKKRGDEPLIPHYVVSALMIREGLLQ